MSGSLRPHESQHARPPCPSPTPRVHSDSRPLSQWCHPAIASSVVPFSSCPQSLLASESFPMSQLFAWGGQSIGVSVLASFLHQWLAKNPPANAGGSGDLGLISGLGWSPGGKSYPLQYSCQDNSMDRGAWRSTVHRVAKRLDWVTEYNPEGRGWWVSACRAQSEGAPQALRSPGSPSHLHIVD